MAELPRDRIYHYESDGENITVCITELVRCKDCIHGKMQSYAPPKCPYECTLAMNYHDGNHFCALGERREE